MDRQLSIPTCIAFMDTSMKVHFKLSGRPTNKHPSFCQKEITTLKTNISYQYPLKIDVGR